MTRVLIIEDEESYREATAFMLRKEGFEVDTAANGADGLESYSRNGADIVLLDLMMPGIPGTEVCRQLRRDHHGDGQGFRDRQGRRSGAGS